MFHECPGASATARAVAQEERPSLRFAPWYYLGQAIAIARFDDKAVHRAARDNNCFVYGAVFTSLGVALPSIEPLLSASAEPGGLIVALPMFLLLALVIQLILWGMCHLVARGFLRGRGEFGGIARTMLMGSIVGVVGVIPSIGPLVSGLWGLAIMMVVFEEIHGIRRIQAFAISFGIGTIFEVVRLMV